MDGFLFLLYAPLISVAIRVLCWLIAIIVQGSKSSSYTSKYSSTPKSYSSNSTYRNSSYSHPCYDIPDCGYNSYSSLESEMKDHNARMEQMMREQQVIMIENELRRINESTNKPLSEQFDSRLTNIFRNPWDGIL